MIGKGSGLLLLVLFLNGCPPPPPPVASCACDEYPFPLSCQSQCQAVPATVESVNTEKRTAVVKVGEGAAAEEKTVPLSELPITVPLEKGAQFRALSQKETTTPNSPRILHFVKEPPTK